MYSSKLKKGRGLVPGISGNRELNNKREFPDLIRRSGQSIVVGP
jgi:hypothetical protein